MKPSKKDIETKMRVYGLTEQQAIELWKCDNGLAINEEQEKLCEKAKNYKIDHGYTQDKKTRKKVEKVRKIDNEKLEILTLIAETLENRGIECEIVKEIEVKFKLKDDFTLKLTRHRNKK